MEKTWQIWIDTGGTFTDCLALNPEGKLKRAKVLSNSSLRGFISKVIDKNHLKISEKWSAPDDFITGFEFRLLDFEHEKVIIKYYDSQNSILEISGNVPFNFESNIAFEVISPNEAPILAAKLVTQTSYNQTLPPLNMRLGTTRGTNALLERKGAPIALFITKGFGDLLQIGTQQRPDLFALNIIKPEPLYKSVIEVRERISANGSILQPMDLEELKSEVEKLVEQGFIDAAVAFLHSYKNQINEQQLADYLLENGFSTVSLSSQLAPFLKILPRAETAVVDAYLSPVINKYLANVLKPIRSGKLHVMTSAGGLIQANSYHPKDSLLSGPAGGVVGAAFTGKQSGFNKIIAFDMGGTSTDVARFDGDFEYLFEHKVGDAHLVAPALAIESVAAGGGSICSFDDTKLTVGPESAGASPGPACYGAGGPLTLTDVNLLLGRLDPNRFEIPIDRKKAEIEIEQIKQAIEEKTGEKINIESILEGFLNIANERMADAIRKISLRKGYDPTEYTLVAFGGAGAQHACGVAEKLGMSEILIPKNAGLLSALGLGQAVIERFAQRQILLLLEEVHENIQTWFEELSVEVKLLVKNEGIFEANIQIRRKILNLRFVGQDSTLSIDYEKNIPIRQAFEERYRTIYGHWPENCKIEIESIRVVASSFGMNSEFLDESSQIQVNQPRTISKSWFDGNWREIPTVERDALKPGDILKGSTLVFELHSASVLDLGWKAEIDSFGTIICRRQKGQVKKSQLSEPEVVKLELFTNRFQSIAQEMGEILRRTALSTNVKERLDFSCALLDPDGELVVNAPHIPVHLGAMGFCLRALKMELSLQPGDVVMTNHPSYGGSHLPDITVITPVFVNNNELIGYVANRAHHAEIGGIRPGSMPPMAKNLAEEGVVIPPTYIIKQGEAKWDDVQNQFENSKYPSRSVEENLTDLNAAVAANQKGMTALQQLVSSYGQDTVLHYMEALKQRAESKVREALRKLPNGIYEALEKLDDGSPLKVKIEINNDHAKIDFSGSADVHPGNMNAVPAIIHSAVIYVLRLLLNEQLPLNEGLMRAIELNIPPGILNPSFPADATEAPSIVGGNVETSQRLVDTLLKALKLVACSQGTMNNVLFGSDKYSYYETICGGCGAGPDFHGANAVHSHMTNTRITDPEIVENRFPVRIEKFAIRANSGGEGKHRGGNGTIREITFLDKMSLSVLSQHRKEKPYGLKGGKPGKKGSQQVIRKNGEIEEIGSIDGCIVNSGDRLIVKTPGGGGFGKTENNEQ